MHQVKCAGLLPPPAAVATRPPVHVDRGARVHAWRLSAYLHAPVLQPWAGLLVYGLKRVEGRGWPTSHRGRLWIHSTAQQPSQQDIEVGAARLVVAMVI